MKRILTAALALCLLWQGIPTAFAAEEKVKSSGVEVACLLYTSPSPRDTR